MVWPLEDDALIIGDVVPVTTAATAVGFGPAHGPEVAPAMEAQHGLKLKLNGGNASRGSSCRSWVR